MTEKGRAVVDPAVAQARPGAFRQVVRVLATDRKALVVGAAGTLVASGSGLLGPWLVSSAIAQVRAGRWSEVGTFAALFAGVSILGAVVSALVGLFLGRAANRIVGSLRERSCRAAMGIPVSRLTRHPAGDLVSRCANDTEHLGAIYQEGPIQAMGAAVVLVGASVGMWLADWMLCLLVLPLVGLVGTVASVAARPVGRASLAHQHALGAFSAEAHRCLESLLTIRANTADGFAAARLAAANRALVTAANRSLFARSVVGPVMQASAQLAAGVVLGVVIWRSLSGGIEPDRVVAFFMYAAMLVNPLAQVGSLMTAVAVAAGALGRLDELDEFARESPGDAEPVPAHGPGDPGAARTLAVARSVDAPAHECIRFRDVGLTLPSPHDPDATRILRGVSFTVDTGSHVVLTGPSGGGKSSILALLERFYAPSAGEVTLGGIDIATLDVLEYRRALGYVEQGSPLFRGTVRDNLTLGSPELGDEECWDMLDRLRLADVVRARPEGLRTAVGQGKDTFSGGQRQRLALARALLRRPRILLLDEATSALDERAAQAAWAAVASSGATVIHAGHGQAVLERADLVLVVAGGRVVEEGPAVKRPALGPQRHLAVALE